MGKSFAVLFLALAVCSRAYAEAPAVVVSIKPLHSLVAQVMEGVGQPGLILSGTASPHTYAMKPSDARALQAAKLVIWVGPGFESWLERSLAKRADTLAFLSLPGLTTLATREGGVWEEDHDEHDHHHGPTDGHLWLDPANARVLVRAVAERLATLDPANADTYRSNAAKAEARLTALDDRLMGQLAAVAGKPYVVFHDAYQYLEHRYGLSPAGAITVDPERPASGKRLAALRDRLRQTQAACVFREPQFAGPLVQSLAEGSGAKVDTLDPEATQLPPGPGLYDALMSGLADSLTGCLSLR